MPARIAPTAGNAATATATRTIAGIARGQKLTPAWTATMIAYGMVDATTPYRHHGHGRMPWIWTVQCASAPFHKDKHPHWKMVAQKLIKNTLVTVAAAANVRALTAREVTSQCYQRWPFGATRGCAIIRPMTDIKLNRRGFLGAGLATTGLALLPTQEAAASPLTEKEKLAKIASNTWPLRQIFKTRNPNQNPQTVELKKKYGEITMLDMPQFTKDTFPGVTKMDLFSGLFGDVTDDSMYTQMPVIAGTVLRQTREFEPSSASGKQWLSKLANKMAATGTSCQHISNNAPRDIADPDPEKRKAGVEVAKKWMDGGKIIGAKSMRVNSGGPRIAPNSVVTSDYPKNGRACQVPHQLHRVDEGTGRPRLQSRGEDYAGESLGAHRQPDEHPDHQSIPWAVSSAKPRRTSATGSTST